VSDTAREYCEAQGGHADRRPWYCHGGSIGHSDCDERGYIMRPGSHNPNYRNGIYQGED
jgi:hypothetical protein